MRLSRFGPALLFGLILLFFWKLAFSGLILARGDTFLYFYPYWQAAAEALAAGRVPLWNDQIFMGAPFIANSQVGFFYPLNWPLWLALPTPYAVSASIVVHLIIAAAGCYVLARRQMRSSVAAAFLAALAFALSGYLTAQVEHVNQLQGLAWLPWLLAVGGGERDAITRNKLAMSVLLTGLILALQLSAGHTQTLFISAVALALFRVVNRISVTPGQGKPGDTSRWAPTIKQLARVIGLPVVSALIAALLAAVQLLPTLQLAQLSSREGGLPLNEAVSFSLHPLLLPQALLPRYGEGLFTEYVAFLPLTVILLAMVAVWRWQRMAQVLPPLALAGSGLFLALGRFNPLYLLLAGLPGFSYFRAPARWMALYALGMALLAGIGLDILRRRYAGEGVASNAHPLRLGVGLVIGLILLGFASVPLAQVLPVGPEAPEAPPSWLQVVAWIAELALAYWLLRRLPRVSGRQRQATVLGAGAAILVALFLASRTLPYNNLTTPAAYLQLRPPIARLIALQRCDLLPEQCSPVPGRLLSLSQIFFDPGDLPEIQAIYAERLSEEALYDYIIAVKQKEIIAPNLPLAFGLASVDGFDGGLLPLRDYIALMDLILPPGVTTGDGRLREYLDAVPEARWLDLFHARHVITDKVGDVWRQGVFFDTQLAQTIEAGAMAIAGYLPQYEATDLWLLAGEPDGTVSVTTVAGDTWQLEAEVLEDGLLRYPFPEPAILREIVLSAGDTDWQVTALALVDRRDATFQSVVLGAYRLIYSGDVKIYENLDVLPRAFLVGSWHWAPNAAASIDAMSSEDFDPAREAVIVGAGTVSNGGVDAESSATIVSYAAEEIIVETDSDTAALLVISDAYYPGWHVAVDGEAADVRQVNGLFRGVLLSAGEHEVRFWFSSPPFAAGRLISSATIVALSAALLLAVFKNLARRGGRDMMDVAGSSWRL